MASAKLTVKGMHCKSCKMLVEDSLSENGISNIKIDLDEKKQMASVAFDGDAQKAKALIEAEGYRVL
jgi:copper chaperone CopZ